MSLNISNAKSIRRYQSETDAVLEESGSTRYGPFLWMASIAMAVGAVATFFIPVDRVVTSQSGKITSSDQTIVVQALNPSIIRSIDVKKGQPVSKGQLLATLDSTFTGADLTQYKMQVAGLQAEIERAEDEYQQKPFAPVLDSDLKKQSYLALEKRHYDQMIALYKSSVNSFDEKIGLEKITIDKYKNDQDEYKSRLDIARKQEAMEQTLVAHKTDSLLSLLTATDARLEIERQMTFSANQYLEALHTYESSKSDRQSYIENWYATVLQEIVTARNNLDQAQSALQKAQQNQDLVRMTAPEDSTVLNIDPVSVSSVLKQGDELMTLVPTKSPIVVEADVSTRDVGFVREGDPVKIKIDTLDPTQNGYVSGHVRWISANAFTTDANGGTIDSTTGQPIVPYYKTRVSIDAYHFLDVPPKFRLTPGMTISADIAVGSRSLGQYIIGSSLRSQGAEAMR